MKFFEFNCDDSGEVIGEADLSKANRLLNTSEGKTILITHLMNGVDALRVHPEVFLEQLRASIESELKRATNDNGTAYDWLAKDAMRLSLAYLDMVKEAREVIRRHITKIENFENEADEIEYRKQQNEK